MNKKEYDEWYWEEFKKDQKKRKITNAVFTIFIASLMIFY